MIITMMDLLGTRKSTVAKRVATELDFELSGLPGAYVSQVRLFMLDALLDLSDEAAIVHRRGDVAARRLSRGSSEPAIVTYAASKVAKIPGVRSVLVSQQQQMAHSTNIVCEGRDQGTVVFPKAECKFFLTAQPEERAKRRMLELEAAGETVEFATLLKEQQERDERDENRAVAPLKPATDAQIIETSSMTIDQVVNKLVVTARSHADFPAS
ncbi:UNVERIFIED_CONTAM: hypothetical protein GTU68_064055 [Idotea baltica]|nr:hypothetical protein [Idotea baltica]